MLLSLCKVNFFVLYGANSKVENLNSYSDKQTTPRLFSRLIFTRKSILMCGSLFFPVSIIIPEAPVPLLPTNASNHQKRTNKNFKI